MFKVEWYYFPNNMTFGDQIVAKLCKEDGTEILNVFEEKDRHVVEYCPGFKYLAPVEISYRTELGMIIGVVDLDKHLEDILFERLRAGCSFIEEDFKQQITNIERMLN